MRAVVKSDPGGGEQVGDRHHGRADNAKGRVDPMHLKGFDEGFFGGHFHGSILWAWGKAWGKLRVAAGGG